VDGTWNAYGLVDVVVLRVGEDGFWSVVVVGAMLTLRDTVSLLILGRSTLKLASCRKVSETSGL
jgi:hypothetical protein